MTAASSVAGRAGKHPAIVAAAVGATFLQAVNISIPNAAVRHLQGALSMTDDELGWLFSSYIAASAVMMPVTRWLADSYGRKRVFLTSLAIFALGTWLNSLAIDPLQLVSARILQGAASGPLAPMALAILLDERPPPHHGRLSLHWTATLLLGTFSGPTIGGWLAEYFGWRSIFYVSLPVVLCIFVAMALLLSEKRAEARPDFDFFGFGTFSVGMLALQMLLDRGERVEWFASAEIWLEAIAAWLGFYLFVVHVFTSEGHFLNKALFKDRNYVLSLVLFFALGFVLLPTLALTSPMLEELLGYPADTTGYLSIPRGAALIGAFLLAWRTPTWLDNRAILIIAIALVVYGSWRMLGYSPLMDWRPVVVAGTIQGLGLGALMPALTREAFSTLEPRFQPEAIPLFALTRLYGSTIGIAVVQIYFQANTQTVHLALGAHLTPFGSAGLGRSGVDLRSLAMTNELVTGQAAMIAIIGQFKLLMLVMLAVSPLVFFLQRPRRRDFLGASR